MRRSIVLAWQYLRLAVMNELQYRINFVIQLFETAIALATALVVLSLVYAQTESLGGWRRYELQSLLGIYTVLTAVVQMSIQPNIERLMTDIQKGTFDFVLLKPIDAQVQISIREVRVWQFVDIVAGVAILTDGLVRLGTPLDAGQIALFGLTLLLGIVLIYTMWLLMSCIAFWVIRVDNIFELFDNIASAGRLPVDIYPRWMRVILTYLVPMAFAVTVPAEVIIGRINMSNVAIQAAVTVGFLVVTRFVWTKALVRYNGASS
jgi:ABC-2 type transport system permease protein